MNELHPYAAAYKHIYHVEQEEKEKHAYTAYRMIIKRGHDQQRYNLFTSDEVAAVFV